MPGYRLKRSRYRVPRRVIFLLVALLVLMVAGAGLSRRAYNADMKPVSADPRTRIFTVESGESVRQIANGLQQARLIRSAWAFQLYVHSKELGSQLQAGTYALSPSEDTPAIVDAMTQGKVTTRWVVILPGRRIDQVRADLINDGFTPADVDRALEPSQYADLLTLAYKPAGVDTLEGLLWPDSFQRNADTSPSFIVRESLIEMGQHLTPDVQAAFAAENLTTYQGLIMASMVEQEVSKSSDRPQVAQVFLARLRSGAALGSDVTARYGAIEAGQPPSLSYDSPYNTLKHTGLPPSPISTVSADSLKAVTHPANTNWLYFVTGDNGTTYFSTNLQDHEALTQKYCHKLCGQ